MGLAIVFIMLCHTVYPEYTFFRYFQCINQVGVDIFFFLSGLGLYSSFYHNSSIGSFYKKRFYRIMPAYIFVTIVCSILGLITSHTTFKELAFDFSLITFFTSGNLSEWYIAAIMLLYILFPLIYNLSKNEKIFIFSIITIVIFSFIISIIRCVPCNIAIINEIFIVRIPIFLCGVLFGKKQIEEKRHIRFNALGVVFFFLVSVILCIINIKFNNTNMSWANRFLFLPLACSILILASSCMNNPHLVLTKKTLGFLGTITLELYLIHEKVQSIIFCFFPKTGVIPYLLCIVSVVSISIISSAIISNLLSRFTCKSKALRI